MDSGRVGISQEWSSVVSAKVKKEYIYIVSGPRGSIPLKTRFRFAKIGFYKSLRCLSEIFPM